MFKAGKSEKGALQCPGSSPRLWRGGSGAGCLLPATKRRRGAARRGEREARAGPGAAGLAGMSEVKLAVLGSEGAGKSGKGARAPPGSCQRQAPTRGSVHVRARLGSSPSPHLSPSEIRESEEALWGNTVCFIS